MDREDIEGEMGLARRCIRRESRQASRRSGQGTEQRRESFCGLYRLSNIILSAVAEDAGGGSIQRTHYEYWGRTQVGTLDLAHAASVGFVVYTEVVILVCCVNSA